ncbi:hypothetical protein LQ567_25535 [Niabella pedocola]|uniref:DUF4595 domain-containing protein n=1 Tax=Niabella pedocola TaxID=1752077 RepID=A0ABS8Q0M0_9BACT|nr:hypothetical protein [Niabella pedocola]MCD2426173.1 hypothetical protein [Niabella pedocola]
MRYTLAVLLLAAAFSCKKERTTTSPEEREALLRVTEIENAYNNDAPETLKVSYDPLGRISSSISGDKKYLFNYQTPSALQISRYKISDNTLVQTIDCMLNTAGAITKETYRNASDNAIFYTYQYGYNADGYMILAEAAGYNNSYKWEFIYTDGLLTQSKYYEAGVYKSITHFKYDASVTNKTNLPHWWTWASSMLYGKPEKYALVEIREFDTTNKLIRHWTSSYQYDAAGKVLTESKQSQLSNDVQRYRYKLQ